MGHFESSTDWFREVSIVSDASSFDLFHRYAEFNDSGKDISTTPELSLFQTKYYSQEILRFGAVMLVINSILGIWGNFVTIMALAVCPKLKNATTVFVINLCLADGLFCAFGPPLTATTFLNRKWTFHEKLCSFKVFSEFTNSAVSMFTMAAIAINRYVLIAHPGLYPKVYTKKTVVSSIVVVWAVPLAFWLPPLFGKWGQFGIGKEEGFCTHVANETGTPKQAFICKALGTSLVAVIILFCHFRIVWIVRHSTRNLRRHKKTARRTSTQFEEDVVPNTELKKSPALTEHTSSSPDLRLLRISLVILVVYIFCYVPIDVVRLSKLEKKAPAFNIFAYLAFSYSTCVNPIIYVVMSREYRLAYKNLLCNKGYGFRFFNTSSSPGA